MRFCFKLTATSAAGHTATAAAAPPFLETCLSVGATHNYHSEEDSKRENSLPTQYAHGEAETE